MKRTTVALAIIFASSSFIATAQLKGMGMLFDDKAYMAVPMIEKPLGFGDNLPKSVSLRQYVPAIGDQGDLGTCTGWASTYYLATMEYAILSGKTNRAEISALAFDPLYTYLTSNNSGKSDEACDAGRYTPDVASFLVGNDVKRKMIDSASCGVIPNWSVEQSLLDITDYYRLFDIYTDGEEAVTAVCQSLANNHPVLIGINVPKTFGNIGKDGVFNSKNSNDLAGGHALCVVGYDDEKLGGCFTVVNSWGEEFGEDGFFYMTYNDFVQYTKYGFSFETSLKSVDSGKCLHGDCENGYGVLAVKKEGRFEGYFSNGKMGKGIYVNSSKKKGKGGIRYINKLAKKHVGEKIHDDDYDVTPIGFIKSY